MSGLQLWLESMTWYCFCALKAPTLQSLQRSDLEMAQPEPYSALQYKFATSAACRLACAAAVQTLSRGPGRPCRHPLGRLQPMGFLLRFDHWIRFWAVAGAEGLPEHRSLGWDHLIMSGLPGLQSIQPMRLVDEIPSCIAISPWCAASQNPEPVKVWSLAQSCIWLQSGGATQGRTWLPQLRQGSLGLYQGWEHEACIRIINHPKSP